MRTIDKILLKAGYNKEILNRYYKYGIINGCGGKKGFNFDKFAKKLVSYFPNFKRIKYIKLLEDLKYLCFLHDLGYILADNLLQKIKEDFLLAYRIFLLLHKAFTIKRITAGLLTFIGTSI
jgi:hypothetical protein